MNEKEFKECSVIAYPHEIRFLHIKGGRISYYVDRHISDYVNKLQEENQKLKKQISDLECLVESIKLGVTLNQEKEELLDKILFRSDK